MAKKMDQETLDTMNIYQKLAIIRKNVEVVQKNKEGYGYKYVSEDEILARITYQMDDLHLSLIPSVVPQTLNVLPYSYTKTKGSGAKIYEDHVNEVLVFADSTWTWINNDNPAETLVVPWIVVGQQSDASQAFGSGLTYSGRYFLLKFFNVATPDADPDSFRSKQRSAEAESDKLMAKEIVAQIDSEVRAFLATKKDEAANVKELMKNYAKGGNYLSITDSKTAAQLLSDFRTTFIGGNE